MAEFIIAYSNTAKWEGGYVNDPDDKGGETYAGISRKNWPNWEGWKIIDRYKEKASIPKGHVFDTQFIYVEVQEFYRTNFWGKIKGDQINNQAIANILYDQFVNSGYRAVEAMQKVVGVKADGLIGPATLSAINGGCQENIFNKFKALREKFYRDIVARNPSQSKFLNGWLNRLNSFTFK